MDPFINSVDHRVDKVMWADSEVLECVGLIDDVPAARHTRQLKVKLAAFRQLEPLHCSTPSDIVLTSSNDRGGEKELVYKIYHNGNSDQGKPKIHKRTRRLKIEKNFEFTSR